MTKSNTSKGIGETIGQLSSNTIAVACEKEASTNVPKYTECNLDNLLEQILKMSRTQNDKTGEKEALLGILSATNTDNEILPTAIPAMAEILLHIFRAKLPNRTRLV